MDFLIDNGIVLSKEQHNNENSIFSICLLNEDFQLFNYLYDKINDINIFSHKVYDSYYTTKKLDENFDSDINQKGETLYDFLNKNKIDKSEINMNNNYNRINRINNYNNNINNINNINNNINNFNSYNNLNLVNWLEQSLNQGAIYDMNISNNALNKNEFNYFNFLNSEVLMFLSEFTQNIIIKINNNIYNIININENNKKLEINSIVNYFNKNNNDYISDRINYQRNIISESLFRYCISKDYKEIIGLILSERDNLILVCNDLVLFKRQKDLNNCLLRILSLNNNDQSKLINLKDKKGQTIYHFLPYIEDNLYLYKKLENHNISNIYDLDGNTPLFNACKNFSLNFIEIFTHYSFELSSNQSNKIKYNLFLETKNKKTPLEALYKNINKNENKILKLIIDISINTKTIIFVPLIKYLIHNYTSQNNNLFKIDYKTNLNSSEYMNKVIGLYQFYINELKGKIMIKDELGNDPFFICVQNNNYDFMFNVLLEEHDISFNSTNNEGKSIIHLIVNISRSLKEDKKSILLKAINSGFDFNIKDNNGMLPIDYARLEGDKEIVNILNNCYKNAGIEIKESNIINLNNKINYDYNKDSDTFYNESISVSMNIDKSENLNGLVSPMFKYDPIMSFYQVCVDEDNLPFSVNLVKKDFNNLNLINNDKKFCLQIIKDINKDNEYLTIAVDNLDVKTYTFQDFKSAQQKFKDLFKEITANDWDNVKYNRLNFKTDYTKYYIFDYTYEEENAIYDYLKITIKNLYIKWSNKYLILTFLLGNIYQMVNLTFLETEYMFMVPMI